MIYDVELVVACRIKVKGVEATSEQSALNQAWLGVDPPGLLSQLPNTSYSSITVLEDGKLASKATPRATS